MRAESSGSTPARAALVLVLALVLGSCGWRMRARQRACLTLGGTLTPVADVDACQLPSPALPCPIGYDGREVHGVYVVCTSRDLVW